MRLIVRHLASLSPCPPRRAGSRGGLAHSAARSSCVNSIRSSSRTKAGSHLSDASYPTGLNVRLCLSNRIFTSCVPPNFVRNPSERDNDLNPRPDLELHLLM